MKSLFNQKGSIRAAVIIFCTLVCMYLLVMPFVVDKPQISRTEAQFLDSFDIYIDEKLVGEELSLPYATNDLAYKYLDLYTTVPKSNFEVSAIKFGLFLKNAWVYIDDELIYENVFEPSWFNDKFPGSTTCVAVLPYQSEGKQLHIRFERICDDDYGPTLPINIIDGAITTKTAQNGFPILLLLMVSLIFISFILMLIAILYRKLKMNVRALMSLAITVLCVGCWTLCNTKMFEVFTDNRVFIHNLEYISFYVMPLVLLSFIKRNWERPSFLLKLAVDIALGFYALSMLLRLFNLADFTNLLTAFHFLVIFYVSVITYEIVVNYKNRPASFKYFCGGMSLLIIAVFVEIYFYYNSLSYGTIGSAFMLGLGLMCVILIFCFALTTKEQIDQRLAKIEKTNISADHNRYEMLISNTSDIFMDWQIETDTAYFSNLYEDYFGEMPITENFGKLVTETNYIEKFNLSKNITDVYKSIEYGIANEVIEGRFIHPSGENRWFEISVSAVLGPEQRPSRIIGIIRDVTKEKRLLEEYTNRNEFIKVNAELYDNVLEADITENRITGKNSETLADMLGMHGNFCYSEIIDKVSRVLTHEDFSEEYREIFSRDRILSLYESKTSSFTYECIEKYDGKKYAWVRLTVCIYKSDITHTVRIISYVKDIDVEKKREIELLNSSKTDSLSGLLNKGAMKTTVKEFLSTNPGGLHAFIMLDADNFKAVNDTMGHIVGDTVIQKLGKRFKELFKADAIIGRIGGDEFAVFVKNIESSDDLAQRLQELSRKVKSTVTHGDKTLTVSMSIGACIYPDCGKSYEELYKNADLALYDVKNKGRNSFSIYSPK